MDYKKLSKIADSAIADGVNPVTLIEEVLDADFQVIKREIDEKGSCFKTAEKIASLIGSTKGGVKEFQEQLKKQDIRGISYKKGKKEDYKGIHGTVVYGASDSEYKSIGELLKEWGAIDEEGNIHADKFQEAIKKEVVVKRVEDTEDSSLIEFKEKFEDFLENGELLTTITLEKRLTEPELQEVWEWANELVESEAFSVRVLDNEDNSYYVELIDR